MVVCFYFIYQEKNNSNKTLKFISFNQNYITIYLYQFYTKILYIYYHHLKLINLYGVSKLYLSNTLKQLMIKETKKQQNYGFKYTLMHTFLPTNKIVFNNICDIFTTVIIKLRIITELF